MYYNKISLIRVSVSGTCFIVRSIWYFFCIFDKGIINAAIIGL